MKTQLANLLDQEMDRKEFIRYVGVALLMLAGGGAIMQALGSLQSRGQRETYGYGSSLYGGRR